MAGLTSKGFEVKDLGSILKDLRRDASSSFLDLAPDGESVDVSDSSVIGRLSKLVAPSLADLWESAQDIYTSFDPDTATGVSLDNLVKYSRLSRRVEESSTTSVELIAEEGITLPENSSVAISGGEGWRLPPALSFAKELSSNGVVIAFSLLEVGEEISLVYTVSGVSYSAIVTLEIEDTLLTLTDKLVSSLRLSSDLMSVESLSVGEIKIFNKSRLNDTLYMARNCSITDVIRTTTAVSIRKDSVKAFAGQINRIETPILGWKSVVNISDAIVGRPKESDEALRERFKESKYSVGYTSADAIYSKLRGLEGVRDVVLYENNTDVESLEGVPPHAFMAIVLGGEDKTIGKTIWDNRPLGILSVGNTPVSVVSIDGRTKKESFERPAQVPVKIKIEINKEYNFPESGVTLIKNSILNYFSSNYRIGEDVYYSKLFIPINKVEGQNVSLLKLSRKEEEFGYNNVEINFNEVAVISYSDIEITSV